MTDQIEGKARGRRAKVKTYALLVRYSAEERARLEQRAAAAGKTLAEFVRIVSAAEKPAAVINRKTEAGLLAYQIERIDSRLMQIAAACNASLDDAKADVVIDYLVDIRAQLTRLIRTRDGEDAEA